MNILGQYWLQVEHVHNPKWKNMVIYTWQNIDMEALYKREQHVVLKLKAPISSSFPHQCKRDSFSTPDYVLDLVADFYNRCGRNNHVSFLTLLQEDYSFYLGYLSPFLLLSFLDHSFVETSAAALQWSPRDKVLGTSVKQPSRNWTWKQLHKSLEVDSLVLRKPWAALLWETNSKNYTA